MSVDRRVPSGAVVVVELPEAAPPEAFGSFVRAPGVVVVVLDPETPPAPEPETPVSLEPAAPPGAVVVEPGAVVVEPGDVVVDPGAVVVEPGAVVVEPGAVVELPDPPLRSLSRALRSSMRCFSEPPEPLSVEPDEPLVLEPDAPPGAVVVEPGDVVDEPDAPEPELEPPLLSVSRALRSSRRCFSRSEELPEPDSVELAPEPEEPPVVVLDPEPDDAPLEPEPEELPAASDPLGTRRVGFVVSPDEPAPDAPEPDSDAPERRDGASPDAPDELEPPLSASRDRRLGLVSLLDPDSDAPLEPDPADSDEPREERLDPRGLSPELSPLSLDLDFSEREPDPELSERELEPELSPPPRCDRSEPPLDSPPPRELGRSFMLCASTIGASELAETGATAVDTANTGKTVPASRRIRVFLMVNPVSFPAFL